MMVTVKLFARARDLAKRGEVRCEVGEPATVADVRRRLCEQVPALAELVGRSLIAVDEEFAENDVIVRESSEVALIPPVSGG